MPADGYTAMFERMLDHPLIDIELETDGLKLARQLRARRMIFTGPVDEYFGHVFGRLPYRSLRFDHETLDQPWFQPSGTVNYPQTEAFTRITEFKHLTGDTHARTAIVREYPEPEGDPYYPVPRPQNQQLYKRYEALALAEPATWFVGRLASYRYYNMDQVVGQALATFRRIEADVPRARAAA
jgi:UDP-galactopyranose mutase